MLRQPLANKYRPRNFIQLKGQDIFVKILSNAITSNKIANAYLITGIRGVGKTTTARIVAKTLNCSDIKIENDIPVPCEQCLNCTSVNNFSHPDILEVDAASKTGVNDIREIIENAKYKPLLGKYKVYIIDEMHMLSNSAFNALLKTLEEPPANVLFIFATTEVHKIPITIISRCQRFDLARLSSKEIVDNLAEIAEKEGIKYQKDSLNLLSKFSEGSVRDSISLLETINLYKKTTESISINLINEVLGIPEIDTSYKLILDIVSGNTESALNVLKQLYTQGTELGLIMEELISIANKVSKALVSKNLIESMHLLENEKQLLNEVKNACDVTSITNIWKILFGGLTELKMSSYPIGVFEMTVIRACHLSKLPSLDSVMNKAMMISQTQTSATTKNIELSSFKDIAGLFYKNKEIIIYKYLTENIRVTSYKKNHIEAETLKGLPDNFSQNVSSLLKQWTGEKWELILRNATTESPQKTLKEQEFQDIQSHDMIRAVQRNFPGAEINKITIIR
jgi:DNA polymerase III subunit gamma/tau